MPPQSQARTHQHTRFPLGAGARDSNTHTVTHTHTQARKQQQKPRPSVGNVSVIAASSSSPVMALRGLNTGGMNQGREFVCDAREGWVGWEGVSDWADGGRATHGDAPVAEKPVSPSYRVLFLTLLCSHYLSFSLPLCARYARLFFLFHHHHIMF